jgi:hypothetical protein
MNRFLIVSRGFLTVGGKTAVIYRFLIVSRGFF